MQVHPSALPEVVEAAYRVLAMVLHPDRSGTGDAAAMAELNWAYAILRDPERRMAYDSSRVPIPVAAPSGSSLLSRMKEAVAAAEERMPDNPARMVLDFGRYAGRNLGELARIDPAYLEWLRRHSSGVRYRHAIDAVLAAQAAFAARRASVSAAWND